MASRTRRRALALVCVAAVLAIAVVASARVADPPWSASDTRDAVSRPIRTVTTAVPTVTVDHAVVPHLVGLALLLLALGLAPGRRGAIPVAAPVRPSGRAPPLRRR